jgi:hypothetical protein
LPTVRRALDETTAVDLVDAVLLPVLTRDSDRANGDSARRLIDGQDAGSNRSRSRTACALRLALSDYASRRLQRLDITAVEADVCKPLPLGRTFVSAALHGVIHCLPGPLSRKAMAVANVAAVLAPTGVLFGASILGPSGPHTRLSRKMLDANNRRGVFDNLDDTEEGLGEILGASFDHVEIETVGSMAIFAATNPRT